MQGDRAVGERRRTFLVRRSEPQAVNAADGCFSAACHQRRELVAGPGGMMDMMRQAREMQKKMSQVQKKVAQMEVTASAGGGMVTAVVSGDLILKQLRIDPKVVAEGDVSLLEDLVLSAVNAAFKQAQDTMAEEMKSVTGGLKIPGLF
jgi:DNA-binding YbaB/EbfC family protein